jgi:uncharacterized C2H2 Zn-finger protein
MTLITEQKNSFCHIHQLRELWTAESYLGCFDCGHIWQTKEQFVTDCEALNEGGRDVIDPETLIRCPLCLHLF